MSMRMTLKEWNDLVLKGELEDISDRLPNSFWLIYQILRALVKWKGKVWYVAGWHPPGEQAYVVLKEWEVLPGGGVVKMRPVPVVCDCGKAARTAAQ
jgi:hypothetical protein